MRERRASTWWSMLGALTLAGLAVRVAYVLVGRRHAVLWGDAYYYHYQAELLLSGRGFIVPFDWLHYHRVTLAADHPPAFTLLLAGVDLLGLKSFAAHRLVMALLGSLSIVLVGQVGRQVAGERAGLFAGAVAAFDPSFWVNDGLVESETLVIVATAVTLWCGYRFWRRPSLWAAFGVGAACGLTALVRAEMALLVPVVGLALVWFRGRSAGERRYVALVGQGAVLLLAAALVVAPWVGRNLATFDHPVYLSDGLDVTLTVANCDRTYQGEFLGYWWLPCASSHPPPAGVDESDQGRWYRSEAFTYMHQHLARVPVVAAARVGRVWGLYRPLQQTRFDLIEGRELWVSRLALACYYPVALAALFGAVTLRRRGIPVFPLVGVIAACVVAVAVTYGNTRYRAASEVPMAVLAGVAAKEILERRGVVRRGADPEGADLVGSVA